MNDQQPAGTCDGALVDAVLASIASDTYHVAGKAVQGNAISCVMRDLRQAGWRNLGPISLFSERLLELGFQFAHVRNRTGAIVATIVTL
jgi:hypothetical protein